MSPTSPRSEIGITGYQHSGRCWCACRRSRRACSTSCRAYLPPKPSAQRYQDVVEEFWYETTYVAKYLWRDELVAARTVLDGILRREVLQPMLEWLIEVEHDWSVNPGTLGRSLKRYVRPAVWAQLEQTYAGPAMEANWRA